ncbi:unnamed protein product [Spirodela intermedia]|uniref:Uncharacterized protein n=1 Tax=Spirodela intermedia TaxID=51605 RepID=A0A7I8IDE8_SPIIN|nr:unnamed protein product [Spirodela intermedia]CAA6655800.1 unnamed protein product [Spirodela intermedia]
MANCSRLLSAILLVMLLAVTGEMMGTAKLAEARTCESQSHSYRGLPRGKCRGFRRRCFCTKHC